MSKTESETTLRVVFSCCSSGKDTLLFCLIHVPVIITSAIKMFIFTLLLCQGTKRICRILCPPSPCPNPEVGS